MTVKLEKDLHIKLKIQAATEDSTLENIIIKAAKMYLQSKQ